MKNNDRLSWNGWVLVARDEDSCDQVWLGCDGCEPTHWMPLPEPPATKEAS